MVALSGLVFALSWWLGLYLLARDPRWNDLQAVRNERVYVTDGNAFFNRPGPRLKESLEMMAEMIHPDHFSFGHAGHGWVRLTPTGKATHSA